jgi:aldose 1-epimerase
MPKAVRLSAGEYRAEIYPDNGGSLGRLFWRDEALLQSSADPQCLRDPSSVGMFPMVPFGGRVADAKFDWRGKCHALPAHPGESHAVHGNAWMEQWTVEDVGRTQARLRLESTCGPLAYRADQHFSLDTDGLHVLLCVTNLAHMPLPFGLGFHPWFPRRPGNRIRFKARRFWLERPGGIPSDPITLPPELDFAAGAELPSTWRNNIYEDWSGALQIDYPDHGFHVALTASSNLDWLMVYANPALDFFCLEPQSHLPDAHNRDGVQDRYGLVELDPGQCVSGSISIRAGELAQ